MPVLFPSLIFIIIISSEFIENGAHANEFRGRPAMCVRILSSSFFFMLITFGVFGADSSHSLIWPHVAQKLIFISLAFRDILCISYSLHFSRFASRDVMCVCAQPNSIENNGIFRKSDAKHRVAHSVFFHFHVAVLCAFGVRQPSDHFCFLLISKLFMSFDDA